MYNFGNKFRWYIYEVYRSIQIQNYLFSQCFTIHKIKIINQLARKLQIGKAFFHRSSLQYIVIRWTHNMQLQLIEK